MRIKVALIGLLMFAFAGGSVVFGQKTEQELVDQFLNKDKKKKQEIVDKYVEQTKAKRTSKPGWAALNFTINRINRHNDYNTFATLESDNIDGADLSWVEQAFSIGAEFGIVFKERFTWSLGGEYWLKQGEEFSGTYTYTPTSGPMLITDPKSEIQVYGAYTGFGYYVMNPPSATSPMKSVTVRVNGSIGYYLTNWDLWSEYENLNLATSLPTGVNTTFKGENPARSVP